MPDPKNWEEWDRLAERIEARRNREGSSAGPGAPPYLPGSPYHTPAGDSPVPQGTPGHSSGTPHGAPLPQGPQGSSAGRALADGYSLHGLHDEEIRSPGLGTNRPGVVFRRTIFTLENPSELEQGATIYVHIDRDKRQRYVALLSDGFRLNKSIPLSRVAELNNLNYPTAARRVAFVEDHFYSSESRGLPQRRESPPATRAPVVAAPQQRADHCPADPSAATQLPYGYSLHGDEVHGPEGGVYRRTHFTLADPSESEQDATIYVTLRSREFLVVMPNRTLQRLHNQDRITELKDLENASADERHKVWNEHLVNQQSPRRGGGRGL
jgi:hypothetical protein